MGSNYFTFDSGQSQKTAITLLEEISGSIPTRSLTSNSFPSFDVLLTCPEQKRISPTSTKRPLRYNKRNEARKTKSCKTPDNNGSLYTLPTVESGCSEPQLAEQWFKSIENNNVHAVKSLMDLGVRIACRDSGKNTGLILAAKNGFSEIVDYLLSAGAAGIVNLANKDGFTALQLSSKRGDKEIVVSLLQNGADMESVNKFQQNAVMLAGRNGHSKVVEILVQMGCVIDRTDRCGRNVLMMAARNGHVEIIDKLLEARACVNAVDHRGKSALSLLVENLCPDTVKGIHFLLDYGADAGIDDENGICALTYLEERVNTGAVPLDDTVRFIAGRLKHSMRKVDSFGTFPVSSSAKIAIL